MLFEFDLGNRFPNALHLLFEFDLGTNACQCVAASAQDLLRPGTVALGYRACLDVLWEISADRCSMNRASSTAYAREGTADDTDDLLIDQEWIDVESGDETAVQPAAAQKRARTVGFIILDVGLSFFKIIELTEPL